MEKKDSFKKKFNKLEREYFLIEIEKRIKEILSGKVKPISEEQMKKEMGWK